MMHRELAWDDLIFVLAVGRTGSLSSAARSLGVNHATVSRRIAGIEERLGVRLFDRLPEGQQPTAAGAEVIEVASRIEEEVLSLSRRLAGEDREPTGILRVTTTDTLDEILVDLCAGFRERYPGIRVDLLASNAIFDLGRREADVAIRPCTAPPESLYGRRVSAMTFAVYAHQDLARRVSSGSAIPWVAVEERLCHVSALAWLAEHVAPNQIVLRASSFITAARAAQSCLGYAILPCHLGDSSPGLERVSDILDELTVDLWLLVHEEMRKARRCQIFCDEIFKALKMMQPSFEGAQDGSQRKASESPEWPERAHYAALRGRDFYALP